VTLNNSVVAVMPAAIVPITSMENDHWRRSIRPA